MLKQMELNNLLQKGDCFTRVGQLKRASRCYFLHAARSQPNRESLNKLAKSLVKQGRILESIDAYFMIAAKYPVALDNSIYFLREEVVSFLKEKPSLRDYIVKSLERIYTLSESANCLHTLSLIHLHIDRDLDKAINLNSRASRERSRSLKKIRWENPEKYTLSSDRLPDFMVLGAPKCGTTALYGYLVKHPQILPPLTKEPQFFSKNDIYERGLGYYKSFFPSFNDCTHLTFEASVAYLSSPIVPMRIKKATPNIKLVFILRNPAERAISDYYMKLRIGQEKRNLVDAMIPEIKFYEKSKKLDIKLDKNLSVEGRHRYVFKGIYYYHIQQYMQLFDAKNILFLNASDLKRNPQEVMDGILGFLNLDSFSVNPMTRNVGKYSKEGSDYELVYEKLTSFYRYYNEKLRQTIGISFSE